MNWIQKHRWVWDSIITAGLAIIATGLSFMLYMSLGDSSANIVIMYILAVMLTARYTTGYRYGIVSSLIGVICINYMFTYPYMELNFTLTGYPVTFLETLAISIMTSATTTLMKKQSQIIKEREKQLMEAEKEKMRANLLRAISHDLRTPLTGMIGNSEAYLENENSLSVSEKIELVQNIHDDANWLLHMVENLLSVTRIEAQSLSVTRSQESVEEVVSEAIMKLRKRMPDAQVKVKVPDEFLMIPMDPMLIEQVIMNLLENAIVHSESKNPVECTVESEAEGVTIAIKDYGIGISEEQIPVLFDGGVYQQDTKNDIHRGMGIGLSICRTIVHAHQGRISGQNHEQGAIFTVWLPKEDSKCQ